MKYRTTWILILSFCLSNVALAMRCGRDLVELGYSKVDVLRRCGDPESVETRSKLVGSTFHFPHRTIDIQEFNEIQVEEWIYNFGPSRLRQYLRFENGELKEIKTLGRGH
ncbi:MAG: DUF2845 domain-containing protein [Methylococcaceae bacterium]|nr:DUF2845 domain-containing protein [Methylococcaceae bacterium]